MIGAINPLPQYAFMAWCLVKAQGLYLFTFYPFVLHAPPISSSLTDYPNNIWCSVQVMKLLIFFHTYKRSSIHTMGCIVFDRDCEVARNFSGQCERRGRMKSETYEYEFTQFCTLLFRYTPLITLQCRVLYQERRSKKKIERNLHRLSQ